jgi:hypothetical protein
MVSGRASLGRCPAVFTFTGGRKMQARLTDRPVEEVIAGIQALDLDPIKLKLMDTEEGQGWSREYADEMELGYKRFLTLLATHPEETLAPSKDVDKFWHGHILDTLKYAEDCDRVFGYFLHHFPYFGMRGAEDAENLARAAEKTRRLYEQEFEAKTEKPAYCGAPRREGVAYCGATSEGAAAYCGALSVEKPAYCGAARTESAYCGATRAVEAAYCGAARAEQPAYCGATRAESAYCGASRTVEAAYCGATRAEQPAYCGATRAESAYCGASRAPKAAYCGASNISDKLKVTVRPGLSTVV